MKSKILKCTSMALIVLLLILSACCQEDELTETAKAEIINGVEQMAKQFFADSDAKNIEGVLGHLDNSPQFFWVFPPDPAHISHGVLAEALTAEMQSQNNVISEWTDIKVIPLKIDLAYYQGTFHQKIIQPDGIESEIIGNESAVVVLRQDGWKFLCGQTYIEIPQPE